MKNNYSILFKDDQRYSEILNFRRSLRASANYCRVIYIYTLIDPDTNMVRYVGKTDNPIRRYNKHINSHKYKGNLHICNWIRCLNKRNKYPIMKIIETANPYNWNIKEQHWIKFHLAIGCKLCNIVLGGDKFSKIIGKIVIKEKNINFKQKKEKPVKIIKQKTSKIPKPIINDHNHSLKNMTKKELEYLYIDLNLTKREIGIKLNCKERTVKKYLNDLDIKKPHDLKVKKDIENRKYKYNNVDNQIVKNMYDDGITVYEISEFYNCPIYYIYSILNKK